MTEIQNTTAIPEIKKTIVIVRHLSGDEKVRQEAYYREKRLHDEATALGHARREGLAEGLTQGRAEGLTQGRAEGLTQGRAEGLTQGRAEGLTQGRAEGRSEVMQELTHRWLEMGMSEAEIKKLLGK